MAAARELAQWIVNNEDKKGTPDFDAVAQALERAVQLESQAAPQPQPPAPPEGIFSSFGRGLASYGPQLRETFGGLQALTGKALAETIAPETGASLIKSGVERIQAAGAEQQAATRPGEASFTDALDKGVGTVLTEWLPYQIGSGAANLLETLGVMGAGALVGSAAPGAGTAVGAITGAVQKELVKKGVREAALKIAKEQGEDAAKQFVENQTLSVTKDLARKVGMNAALAGQAAGYGFGQTASRAVESAIERGENPEDIDLARVIPAGMVSTAAEFVSDKLAFGALKGLKKEVKDAVEDTTRTVLQKAVRTAGDMAKGIAITGTKEAPTEIIQSLAERFGAKLSLSDQQAIDEYINAVAASYAMSVVPGAIGGVKTKPVEAKQGEEQEEPIMVDSGAPVKAEAPISTPEAGPEQTAPLSPAEQRELAMQQEMYASRQPKAEDILGEVRGAIKTAPMTTQEDIARIKDDHETAVINSLLEQDKKMQAVSDLARANQERMSQLESIEAATQDADRRVREGRLLGRVQSLIDQNIPFASTAIADINRKFEMIGEAPLDDSERARVQNIMTMAQGFTDFVKLPSPPVREQDIFAENQAMEALIKERKPRGQVPSQPVRAEVTAPSQVVQETPVSPRVEEGRPVRPEGGIEPSVAEDRQRVEPSVGPVVPETTVIERKAPEVQQALEPRVLDYEGRPVDKQPIRGGDVFSTSSGRFTTPYPKQKSEKYATQWLIDNAIAEAESRGDRFNSQAFKSETPGKGGTIPPASIASMQEYLFGQQPAVPAPFLKPIQPKEKKSLGGERAQQVADFEQTLRTTLNKFGLKDVGLNLVDGLKEAGSYAQQLIKIASDSANPIRDLRHEAIHALRELGFFTDAQWKTLSKMAKDKWIDQYLKQRDVDGKPLRAGEESRYDAYMREYNGDMEKITEEAVADAFADFDAKKAPSGLIQSLLTRLRNLFQAIKSALTKVESPEQIFGKVERGELKTGERRATSEAKSLRAPGKVEEIARKVEAKVLPPKEKIETESFSDIKSDALKAEIQRRFNPKPETVVDRINSMREKFWERMAQGFLDKYRAIKKYSDEGYMLARMSNTVDGAVEGLLFHGQVFNDGGALNIKPNTEGLYEAFRPLGKEVDRFLVWMAMSRDANLPEEKRSFSSQALQAKDEMIEGDVGGRPRAEVYNEVRRKMNALNKSVLDVAKEAGIIDKEGYKRFSSDLYYVPMYKITEEGELVPTSGEKLTDQFFSKELKGNKELAFGDLMQNIVQNWSHILSASMKNIAATKVLQAAEQSKLDVVRPSMKAQYEYENGLVYKVTKDGREVLGKLLPGHTTKKPGTVSVIKDGMPVYYEVNDPLLLDSIAGITWLGPQGKWLDVAKNFKNMLQFGVTISPAFRVRNLIRDSVSAISIADIKKNPVMNAIEGMNFYDPKDPNYIGALAGGGMMKFGAAMEGGMSENIKRLVKAGVPDNTILDSPEKIKNGLKYLYNKYEEWGNKMENANRLAIYQQARAKGMSHLEASFHAKDLMDFTLHGSFPAFRRLTMVIPFLNARVQGLYKLGRDGITPTYRLIYSSLTGKEISESDKKKGERFAIVLAGVGLASAALYYAFKDDEEFKKREQWDRDNFWWIKFPGMEHAFRIPKPFELGAFGTLVERSLEQIVDQGAEGKVFGEAMTRMLSDTFAINPIPQMFKPVLDIYANKDSFTGAPIETAGMEKLSKQERVADSTSWIGKGLGGVSKAIATVTTEKAELSPVQIEYLIKGYFGWLGAMATSTAHYAAMPFSKGAYPDMKYADTFSMGFVKELPATQSKFVTSFYDNNQKIQQAMADMRHYATLGEIEKAQKIAIDQADKIKLAKFYDKASDDMSRMRKYISIITANPNMTGAEKRQEIDRAKLIIAEIARQAEELRVALKE